MGKISKSHAEAMARSIVGAALLSATLALDRAEGDLFEETVRHLWEPYLKTMPTLAMARDNPLLKGLFPRSGHLDVKTVSGLIRLGDHTQLVLEIPHLYHNGWSINVSSELAARIAAHGFERKSHDQRATNERATVMAAILGFGTWRELRDGWPAIRTVIDAHEPEQAPSRALVNVDSLNARLGLPTPTLEPAA